MDFAYDRLQALQTPKPSEDKEETPLDKAADKLESGIEGVYSKLSQTNWSGIWNTVKRQGEIALNETKKEIGSLLAESDGGDTPRSGGEGAPVSGESSSANLAASSETLKPISPTMLGELTKKAQQYIDELDRDLEEMENKAGAYIGKFGKGLKTVLRDAVAIAAPGEEGSNEREAMFGEEGEDAPSEILFNVPEDIRTQIYSTRLEAQLHALHTSEQPFLTETKETGYDEFSKTFDVETCTDEIASKLEEHPELRKLMDSLVPEKVSYTDFWTKYFYMRCQIHEQEQKRKDLLSKVADNEDQVGWDDEDEDADEAKRGSGDATHSSSKESRNSSDNSYDIISKTSSTVDLPSKADSKDESEDDDWE